MTTTCNRLDPRRQLVRARKPLLRPADSAPAAVSGAAVGRWLEAMGRRLAGIGTHLARPALPTVCQDWCA